MSEKDKKGKNEGATFDMYHFFSRRDVIAACVIILIILLYLLYKMTEVPQGA